MNEYDMETPCNSICTFDSDDNICTSCKRTLEEISNWRNMSSEEKKEVMERINKTEQNLEGKIYE